MTGENLLHAMEYIGVDLVDEAEKRQFRKPPRQRWAGLAACFVLLAGLGLGAFYLLKAAAPSHETPLQKTAPEEHEIVIATDPESTPQAPEARFLKLVYRNYIYYLAFPLEAQDAGFEDMGVLKGVVEEGQPLAGAACYYDLKYVSWLADGVPLEMFLEYQEKYYYAFTYGERADRTMAYTYEEARAMTGEMLKAVFVDPIELRALDEDLTYQGDRNPTALDQLALFGGMVWMENRACFVSWYSRADRWLPPDWDRSREECDWELFVPAAEIQALLDTYFDGCTFDPRELRCYDSEQDTVRMDWQYMPYGYERSDFSTSLMDFWWDDETQTVQIKIELIRTECEEPEQGVSGDIPYQELQTSLGEKQYTIQFTDRGPKYLRIEWVEE